MISYCLNNPSKYYFPLKYISLSSSYYLRGTILSERKVDLLGQYSGLVLIPRINRADILYEQGRYVSAIEKQRSVIRALYREGETDENVSTSEKTLKDWLDRIKNIVTNSEGMSGETRNITRQRKWRHRNRLAKVLFEELDWEIWGRLHKLGYFSGKKSYGPPMKDINFETAVSL